MIITNAEENDYETLKSILKDVAEEEEHNKNMPLYTVNFNSNEYDVLKALDKHGDITGFLVAKPYNDYVDILGAIVLKNNRNKGIGKRLFFAIEHLYPKSTFVIKTPMSIPKNIAFYESLGYSESKSSHNKCEDGILCFEKLR